MSEATCNTIPAGIVLREACEADIPKIAAVVNAAFEVESFFVNRPRTYPAQLAEHFRSGHFLVALDGAEVIASVYYELRGERGYIGMLAVRPDWQHRGLGSAMTGAAEEMLRREGCRVAELLVVDLRTALIGAYGKLGYLETGIEEPPEEMRIKLTRPVKLVKMEKPLRPEAGYPRSI